MKEIKKIVIEVIPHDKHRYSGTIGDYWRDPDGTIQIRVSDMSRNEYSLLIAIHEAVEVMLIEHRGIQETFIQTFDKLFEKDREEGNEDEPGDDPLAPYHQEHCIATAVERLMCAEFFQSWKKYEEDCVRVEK
jgi:hypothetical protein